MPFCRNRGLQVLPLRDEIRIELVIDIPDADNTLHDFYGMKEIAAVVLRYCGISTGAASLVFTDDSTIQSLNMSHRGLDEITDVLSFSNNFEGEYYGSDKGRLAGDFEGQFVLPPGEIFQIGEVLISVPQAGRQAKENGIKIEAELVKLVAHGFLHLLGYDHTEPDERLEMEKMEKDIIQKASRHD